MYRDEIFLKLNKHTGFNKYTGVVYFAQSRKKIRIFQKNSDNFGKNLKFSVKKSQKRKNYARQIII